MQAAAAGAHRVGVDRHAQYRTFEIIVVIVGLAALIGVPLAILGSLYAALG